MPTASQALPPRSNCCRYGVPRGRNQSHTGTFRSVLHWTQRSAESRKLRDRIAIVQKGPAFSADTSGSAPSGRPSQHCVPFGFECVGDRGSSRLARGHLWGIGASDRSRWQRRELVVGRSGCGAREPVKMTLSGGLQKKLNVDH